MGDIAERDWRVFRRLAKIALDRYCHQTLDLVDRIVHSERQTNHAKHLEIYRLVHERDQALAEAFNDARRSVAVAQLVRLRSMGLLSDDEMAEFSEELREKVNLWLQLSSG